MASVFLGDLDDFIAPSQACVNPLFASEGKGGVQLNVNDGVDAFLDEETQVALNTDTRAIVKGTGEDGKVAKVSLNDCLACSGCVTSAETVLMEQQSGDALLKSLADPQWRRRVVSVSPASVASIARHFGITSARAMLAIYYILRRMLNVDAVVDTTVAGRASLLLAAEEFVDLYSASSTSLSLPEAPSSGSSNKSNGPDEKKVRRPRLQAKKRHKVKWERPDTSLALSAAVTEMVESKDHVVRDDGWLRVITESAADVPRSLPVLCSECPGWVCYVEKTSPEAIPYLSNVKSGMATTSWLSKVSIRFGI